MTSERVLIFLCSGASTHSTKKLSFRIAAYLQEIGVAEIGSLAMLAEQQSTDAGKRRKMIFINDCNSSCVKILTHRFDPSEYLYINVAPYKTVLEFDIREFVDTQVMPAFRSFEKSIESAALRIHATLANDLKDPC
jgi:uncharacterized metal-binding protein